MRKTLRKWSVISVALMFFLGLMLPAILGFYLKNHYPVAIALVSDATNIDVKLLSQQRHWFYTDTTLLTNLPLIDQPLLNDDARLQNAMVLKQRIYHGPIIFTRSGIHPAIYRVATFYQQHQLAQTALTLLGHIKTDLIVPSLIIQSKEPRTYYSLLGAYGLLDLNLRTSHLVGWVKIHHLNTSIDQPRTIDNFAMTLQLQKTKGGLWIGDRNHHFDRITWAKSDHQFKMERVDYVVRSQIDQQRLFANITASVGNLAMNAHEYGSQNITIKLDNLDLPQIEQLHRHYPLTKIHRLSPADFEQGKKDIMTLLAHGGLVALSSTLHTSWGPVVAQMQFSYPTNPTPGSEHKNIEVQIPSDLFNLMVTDLIIMQGRSQDQISLKKIVSESLSTWQKEGWLLMDGSQTLIHWRNR